MPNRARTAEAIKAKSINLCISPFLGAPSRSLGANVNGEHPEIFMAKTARKTQPHLDNILHGLLRLSTESLVAASQAVTSLSDSSSMRSPHSTNDRNMPI